MSYTSIVSWDGLPGQVGSRLGGVVQKVYLKIFEKVSVARRQLFSIFIL